MIRCFPIVRSLFGLLLFASLSHANILPPDAIVAGRTQNQWAETWWNWVASHPSSTNPVLDSTGAFSSLGNQGQVFFLAGHFGGLGPVTRSATVRNDQYLFFPLANGVTTALDSFYGTSYDQMKQDVIEFVGVGSNFYVELNGSNLSPATNLNGWLQLSPAIFRMNFPPGGIFTDNNYTGEIDTVQRGWWVMLSPLAVGNYSLRFGGMATPTGIYSNFGQNVQNVTYNLNVVPEPAGLTMSLIAFACGIPVLLVRRNRRRQS